MRDVRGLAMVLACGQAGIDRKVVQVGPACRAGHGVIPDATRGLELQPGPVCLLLDRIAIKAGQARVQGRESREGDV